MTRIAVDPLTRIEGHLRIEAQVDGGHVREAWSSSTMFRGMELVMRGRDPRDAWLFAQRICGVCTTVHALASVRSAEDAIGVQIPDNARLMRNIIAGTQWVQDHVDPLLPSARARLGRRDGRATRGPRGYVADRSIDLALAQVEHDVLQRRARSLTAPLESGAQLGLFQNGYWGHPAYHLPPEVDLLAVAHYIEALEWQRDVIKVQALLGGKNPHPQTYLLGGMSIPVDPASQVVAQRRTARRTIASLARSEGLRRSGLHPRRSWRSAPPTRIGPTTVRARETICATAISPRPAPPIRKRSGCRAASSKAATWTTSCPSTSAGSASSSRTRGTRTTRANRAQKHPCARRDDAAFHRSEAALRVAGVERQVFVAQGAAVRRQGDGSRPARAAARVVRVGSQRRAQETSTGRCTR